MTGAFFLASRACGVVRSGAHIPPFYSVSWFHTLLFGELVLFVGHCLPMFPSGVFQGVSPTEGMWEGRQKEPHFRFFFVRFNERDEGALLRRDREHRLHVLRSARALSDHLKLSSRLASSVPPR